MGRSRRKSSFLNRLRERLRGGRRQDEEEEEEDDDTMVNDLNAMPINEELREQLLRSELAQELATAFDQYAKGLRSIPCRETGYVLRTLGQNPTEEEVLTFVCEAGCAWEGHLTRAAFVEAGVTWLRLQAAKLEDVYAAFRAFDSDHDGHISRHELEDAMTRFGHNLSANEMCEMFSEADGDKDGLINFDEFASMVISDPHQVLVNHDTPHTNIPP